jgi:hypothetical protein
VIWNSENHEEGTMISRFAGLVVFGMMFALAGCTTAENPLSQNDIGNMKLTDVTVSVAPKALIIWDEGQRAYAAAKSIPDDQLGAAVSTPEFRDGVRTMLAAKIKAGVEQAMAGQLIGSRPVRLDIVVSGFYAPSVVSRVLIGGEPHMAAAATLVDARTGAVIVANPDLKSFVHGGRGIIGTAVVAAIDSSRNETPVGRLIAQYGKDYREWLTHGV